VTQLQVTACVFGSGYAFYVIAEYLMVCPFFRSFFCTTLCFAVTTLWSHVPYFQLCCRCVQLWRVRRVGESHSLDGATQKCFASTANNDDLLHRMALAAVIKQKLECGLIPNVMATLPNIGGALCVSSVIPFLVRHRKVWLTPAAGVLCSNAANKSECKTWT